MPFHDYSRGSFRNKGKNQPLRHSSPPIYDCTKDSKVKAHDYTLNNNNGDKRATGDFGVDIVDSGFTKDKNKSQKTPFRSNSNPACFEDYSKSKKDLRGYAVLENRSAQNLATGIENSTHDSRAAVTGSSSSHRRYNSFNGAVSSDNISRKHNGAPSSNTETTVVVTKPPSGSPSSPYGVRLRSKQANSPKSSRRRQGLILDSSSISSPVLISHQVGSNETGIKLRDIEQQEELMTKLQIESNETPKKADKSQFDPQPNSVGTRMAERIQRTIKALYTSNSSPKRPGFNLLEESNDQMNESYSPGKRSSKQGQYTQLETSSPKSDKRVSRKRSPKPNVKNNNLQVKDVDGSRRFKWRGSVNRIVKKFGTGQPFVLSGTFGVHLEDCPPSPVNEFVPFIVELCCRIVEERGLYFTGIYRVPGNNASLSALQDDLNNHGVESIRQDDDRLRDLNVVSSLLKSFFRKLPEPLFTNELYHDFIQASRRPKSDDRLNSLRRLVHMLPGPHYETLKFLICHLRLIADNCQENKMEVRNLAIVFGPTLVRNTAADNTATMVTDMSDQCRIIESIIEHAEWFFSDNADEAAPNVPTRGVAAPPDKEHEAVPSIEFLLDNVGRKPGDTGNTSESAKSKGSDDSEKDSFSRDLMDLLFGKKWKQSGQQPTTVEDHGGFEGYQFTNEIDAVKKKEEVTPDMEARPPKSPSATTTSGIPNVSERLLQFYNEHIERITTIGQTFPAFSSADSSPRTTPRHSTILANPIVFPPPVPQRGRSRISSDSDARHATSSHDVYPSHKTPPFPIQDVATRLNDAPRYKHPPNPYNKNLKDSTPTSVISKSTTTFSNSSSTKALLGSHLSSSTPSVVLPLSVYPDAVMEHKNLFPPKYPEPPKIEQKNNIAQNTTETLPVNPKKNTESDMLTTQTKISQLSNNPLGFTHERLVGELPKPAKRVVSPKNSNDSSKSLKQSTPNESDTTSSRKTSTSSLASDNKKTIAQRDATKLSPDVSYRQQKKVRKSPLKENLASGKATTVTSERMFSRYDPKRRGIRFAGNENDQSFSTHGAANTSPAKQLTATERLFNGQQVRRKPSSRENKKNHVIRRHTLSGLQDLEEHASSFANKTLRTNLRQASQNLSMHDLTSMSSSQQQSAIERLNPKGIAPGMTLTNWIRQERMRSKTTQPNGYAVSNKASVIVREKHKESKSQVHSYV